MRITSTTMVALALLLSVETVAAQEGSAEVDARSRELSARMRVTLEQKARVLARMQQDLERAARADSRVRDSIVRETSQVFSELVSEISRLQLEADRVQFQHVDQETRKQLQAQIASARAMANVTRVLAGQQRALTFARVTAPRGYIGVTLSGEQSMEVLDGKVVTTFLSPSVIELVEAGSPAAQAGLEAGDTVIAFGKLPVPGAVPMASVMIPGERLTVRIRRGRRERSVNVVIGSRPAVTIRSNLAFLDELGTLSARICDGESCGVTITTSRRPKTVGGVTQSMRGDTGYRVRGAIRLFTTDSGLKPSMNLRGWDRGAGWSSTDYSIAGAMMTTITAELEELTGRAEGILVLRVAPGTPAATSGLRGGDVIIRIDNDDTEGVRDLQIAVQRASLRGARRVPLVVTRKQKEQPIVLQW